MVNTAFGPGAELGVTETPGEDVATRIVPTAFDSMTACAAPIDPSDRLLWFTVSGAALRATLASVGVAVGNGVGVGNGVVDGKGVGDGMPVGGGVPVGNPDGVDVGPGELVGLGNVVPVGAGVGKTGPGMGPEWEPPPPP